MDLLFLSLRLFIPYFSLRKYKRRKPGLQNYGQLLVRTLGKWALGTNSPKIRLAGTIFTGGGFKRSPVGKTP